MCDYQGTNRNNMSRRSKAFKYSSGRQRAQRLAMLRKEFESNPEAQEITEEDIDDSVLVKKYKKMVLARLRGLPLRALSYTTEHSDKSYSLDNKKPRTSSSATENSNISGSLNNNKVFVLSNTTDHSNKSESPTTKKVHTLSNIHDHSDKSGTQINEKALASSNFKDHYDTSGSPSTKKAVAAEGNAGSSKKMALASSNSTDHSDKCSGRSKKKAVASLNSTYHSDETSDKENQTMDNTSQSNERILYSVAAPIAQEKHRQDDLVPIGSGRTLVPKDKYRAVKWKSYSTATRTLLRAVFSKEVLSTHSLTGKRSPAFPDRPAKMCLDQQKVTDIIIAVRERFVVEGNVIRNLITLKCADESKMMKMRQMKQEENE